MRMAQWIVSSLRWKAAFPNSGARRGKCSRVVATATVPLPRRPVSLSLSVLRPLVPRCLSHSYRACELPALCGWRRWRLQGASGRQRATRGRVEATGAMRQRAASRAGHISQLTTAPRTSMSHSSPSGGSAWNFGAGPGALPASVLRRARDELEQYGGPLPQGTGLSVMWSDTRHTSRDGDERWG